MSQWRTFPTPFALRDGPGGAAVGEGVGFHDEATELQDPREEASLERSCAQGVELTLGAAKGDDGLSSAIRVQHAAVGLYDTLLRCESGAAQFASLQSRSVTIKLP